MLNDRLAGDSLYGKLLFTWLSLVMSMMVSFCAVPFSTRCFWMISGVLLSQSTYFLNLSKVKKCFDKSFIVHDFVPL